MRRIALAALVLASFGFAAGSASAADSCSYDSHGRLLCAPPAPTAVYQGEDHDETDVEYVQYRGGCRGSGLSCEELAYYCSMGSQTPLSIRRYCGGGGGGYYRDGYNQRPNYDRGYGSGYGRRSGWGCRGSDLSCRELQYYCSMGSQTPLSVRRFC